MIRSAVTIRLEVAARCGATLAAPHSKGFDTTGSLLGCLAL